MKRFTVFMALFSISIVALWAFLQSASASQPSSATVKDNSPIPVYDATGEMLKAIHAGDGQIVPVTGVQGQIAPVYDATGAMLDALNTNTRVVTVPVYDATGAMLDAITP